jgi:transposase-like protein
MGHGQIPAAPHAVNLDQLAVVRVPRLSLVAAGTPRQSGENLMHARMLAQSEDRLPPIVVHRSTMRIIDGMHRLHAAELRGEEEIDVRFFDGDDASSFVLAVRANVMHGLPLSLADRKAAAVRIIEFYPQWSDRMIASVSGLAAKTVASARERLTGEKQQLDSRVGRDGRTRPVDAARRKEVAARLLAENPGASLREVARQAGISAETVRGLRASLIRGADSAPPGQQDATGQKVSQRPHNGSLSAQAGVRISDNERRPAVNGHAANGHGRDQNGRAAAGAARSPGARQAAPDGTAALQALRADPAFRSTESGRSLLWMLNSHCILRDHGWQLIENVPAHSMNRVAEAVLACARGWQEFAEHVERQRQVLSKAEKR